MILNLGVQQGARSGSLTRSNPFLHAPRATLGFIDAARTIIRLPPSSTLKYSSSSTSSPLLIDRTIDHSSVA